MTLDPGLLSSFMRQAGNHLWQSTAFAAVAALLALALRSTHARVRYWVWLAASIKFLAPFALLATLGSVLGSWIIPAAPVARVPSAVGQIVHPFRIPEQMDQAAVVVPVMNKAITVTPVDGVTYPFTVVLLAIWLVGFTVVMVRWWNRWRRIRAIVRVATPLWEGREADALRRLQTEERFGLPSVELVSSAARLEPGVFGVFKSVLWLSEGIANHLSETELDAILAHELCHARHRDNLTAAIHMVVEAIFWFHPLVWWMGARLLEERERACDEQVVSLCSEPQAYAEGILKVCEFYVASPLTCAAGVTGADLRKRIEGIMTSRFIAGPGFWKKSALSALLTVAVIGPLLAGIFKVEAQSEDPPTELGQNVRKLEFEVASIKPVIVAPRVLVTPQYRVLGNRVEYTKMTLSGLIAAAYRVRSFQVEGPQWLGHQYFTVVCKIPAGSRDEDVPFMLQSLLAARFRLTVHKDNRAMNVLALVVGKSGLKLRESPPEFNDRVTREMLLERAPQSTRKEKHSGWTDIDGKTRTRVELDYTTSTLHFEASRMTMTGLAASLSGTTLAGDRTVVDMTGLKGSYDVAFDCPFATFGVIGTSASGPKAEQAVNPAEAASYPENGVELLRSLQRLGLDLKKQRALIPHIVVDHVEKIPTEN